MRGLACIVCAGLLPGLLPVTHAQSFPTKPVRIIAPFPPGAGTDTLARTLAPPLTRALGQNIIVENRPGAGTVVGTEVAARAPADGHTLLIIANSFTINPAVRAKLPYDTQKDFAGVARLASTPMVFAVHPSVPVKTLKELIALARARPGELTWASSGAGTGHHLAGEQFISLARINMVHVPYNGGAPAAMAVLGGHTSVVLVNVLSLAPHINAGRLRGLAVTSPERVAMLKELPTVAESGFPGFDASLWLAIMAPAGTPPAVIDRLHKEIVAVIGAPDAADTLSKAGAEPLTSTPAELGAMVKDGVGKYAKIVKQAGVTAQ